MYKKFLCVLIVLIFCISVLRPAFAEEMTEREGTVVWAVAGASLSSSEGIRRTSGTSENGSAVYISTGIRHSKVFVSVKDTGCGIPKESIKKIWERFYKADASRGRDKSGTGLGLSIVREIIQAHGEQIDVVSTEGVGTEFTFLLPKGKSGKEDA